MNLFKTLHIFPKPIDAIAPQTEAPAFSDLSEVRVKQRGSNAATRRVAFDVNNINHRKSYAYFVGNTKWAENSPLFILEATYPSMQSMIESKLLKYYLANDSELDAI